MLLSGPYNESEKRDPKPGAAISAAAGSQWPA